MFRQGDVLLVPVKKEDLPKTFKKYKKVAREDGKCILMYGEATGHHHSFAEDQKVELLEKDVNDMDNRFLKVEEEALLTHQEHDTIKIPKGIFKVTRQREYVPPAPTVSSRPAPSRSRYVFD